MSWIIKAANKIEFAVEGHVKITIGFADIAKRPEVERIKASDADMARKIREAQEMAPQMLKEVVADKLKGINQYAASQGVIIMSAGSPVPEDGNIDWATFFGQAGKPGSEPINKETPNASEEIPTV